MVQVKDLTAAAAKWSRNAGAGASDYAVNAEAAAARWLTMTVAARGNYQQAITSPGIPQRYTRGVQKAGAAKYAARIGQVGQSRYVEGVGVGTDAWSAGFQPYAQALTSLTLTERRPRGDRQNYRRVEEVGNRLNAARLAALGGGA